MTDKKQSEETKETPKATIAPSRLYRSEKNRVIAGVAGGLGEYFNIDPTIIRIIFILLTVFGGSGILIYIILWVVIPSESNLTGTMGPDNIRGNMHEIRDRARTFAHDIRASRQSEDSRFWWALLIIILGFMFLFNNFGIFDVFEVRRLWPIILIILGLSIVLRK